MSDSQTEPKTYSSPKINKVTPEQAKLLLLGQATQGDQGAKDLLDVLFPDRTNTKILPTHRRGKGGFVTKKPSRASRLFIRALTPIRESFQRFVRG